MKASLRNKIIALTLLSGPAFGLNAQSSGNVGRITDNVAISTKKVIADIKPVYLFNENYLDADLVSNGNIILGKKVRLDLLDNKLYYLDNSVEMEVMNPVQTVIFKMPADNPDESTVVFSKGYPQVDKLDENNYYRVLVSGKASLLLDTKFKEMDRLVMGDGMVRSTDKIVTYYGSIGRKIVRLQKTEDLADLFSDRSKEIKEFTAKENIKVKKQADLQKVFTYYNKLTATN